MRSIIAAIFVMLVSCLEATAQPMGKISYQSREDKQVYIMDVCSGEKARITDDIKTAEIDICLSNDGSRIAIAVDLDGGRNKEIYIIDISSGAWHRLTNNPWDEHHPRWSPDDKWIAFAASLHVQVGDDFPIIYKIHIDGTQQQRVVKGEEPSWSYDGQRMAFSKECHIFTIRLSDNRITRLTYDKSFCNMRPAFSPDGKKIAFVSINMQGGLGEPLIYVIDIDTEKQRRLTDADGKRYMNPCWSPDGEHIVFESTVDDSILIMNSRGGDERVLIENARYPFWSPCRPYAVSPHDRMLNTWGALKALWGR